jgi:putative flippase GtrA
MTTTSPRPSTPVPVAAGELHREPAPAAVPGPTTAGMLHGQEQVPVLDVVIPVHNEGTDLAACVNRLHPHLRDHFPYRFRVTVADNASTDRTWQVAQDLARLLPEVTAIHLDAKGRGRALRQAWQASDAAVLAYLDVDLSTDLAALLPLAAPLISGHSDLAIGSRLARGSRVVRGPKREFISRSYNLILRASLAAGFSDAQCGFKAIRADVARGLLPMVEDTGWFFDTELLVLAERAGLRIHEVPVDWVDDPDSRVDIVSTAVDDLKGIARLGRTLARGELPLSTVLDQTRPARPTHETAKGTAANGPGSTMAAHRQAIPPGLPWQLLSFAAIGIASTLAYGLLFLVLRNGFGAQKANLVALLLTAIANTAANRRLTFGVSDRRHAARHQLQGLLVFALGLGLASGSLAALHAASATPTRGVELAVLVVANLVATVLRFLLMRGWIFRRHRHHSR